MVNTMSEYTNIKRLSLNIEQVCFTWYGLQTIIVHLYPHYVTEMSQNFRNLLFVNKLKFLEVLCKILH